MHSFDVFNVNDVVWMAVGVVSYYFYFFLLVIILCPSANAVHLFGARTLTQHMHFTRDLYFIQISAEMRTRWNHYKSSIALIFQCNCLLCAFLVGRYSFVFSLLFFFLLSLNDSCLQNFEEKMCAGGGVHVSFFQFSKLSLLIGMESR